MPTPKFSIGPDKKAFFYGKDKWTLESGDWEVFKSKADMAINDMPMLSFRHVNYGIFYLGVVPGQCGMVLLRGLVYNTWDKVKWQFVKKLCKKLGYTKILATTSTYWKSEAWKATDKWKILDTFLNKRTKNEVLILCFDLYPPKETETKKVIADEK